MEACDSMQDFLSYIPHREPFLFIDRIVSATEDCIRAEKQVKPDEPFFAGHYPGRPLMPGVLICESVFQAGAVLMGKRNQENNDSRIPVVTRINHVKFKHAVLPGDLMEIEVKLKEIVGAAFYMSGRVAARGKTALSLEFTAMLVEETQ